MQILKKRVFLSINILVAGASAWLLAWGPLNASIGGQIAAIVLGTIIAAWVGWQYQRVLRLGEPVIKKRWKRGITGIILALGLVWGCLCLVEMYEIGFFPPIERSRLITFNRLCRAIETTYPYFDAKQIDAASLCLKYREQASLAKTDQAFMDIVQSMLREYNDSHTYISSALQTRKHAFAIVTEIEGKAVVVRVGEIARAAGLLPGDMILLVNGKSIDELISSDHGLPFYGSTPWQQRMNAYAQILSTEEERLRVTVEKNQGEPSTIDLVWPKNLSTPSTGRSGENPRIIGERLSSRVGYIRIPSFQARSGHDLVREFDDALDALLDVPAIILDLRGNPGGSTWISDRIAGRFFNNSFTYGREYYQRRIPIHAWRLWYDYKVWPRGRIYEGLVALLIDGTNLSTAEQFSIALQDSGRAILIGQRTSGGSGNPFCFHLSGGRACFSTGDFRRNNGTPIEGVGVQPDVEVVWTIDDIRSGRDSVLKEAIQVLEAGLRNATQ